MQGENERNNIFIDADAFVAILDHKDPNHKKAVSINQSLRIPTISLITSNFAVGETITVLSQNMGLDEAIRFARKIFSNDASSPRIVEVNRSYCLRAVEKFSQQTSKNSRFTDMINMVLMEELGIDTIFSFDRHYPQAGFKLLSPKK